MTTTLGSTESNTTLRCICGSTGLSPGSLYCDACAAVMGISTLSTTDTKAGSSGSKKDEVYVSTLTSSLQKRGYINGSCNDALFALPYHCCWDTVNKRLLVCDSANHRLRAIDNGMISHGSVWVFIIYI
jgi:hypothetical protein